MLKKRYFKQEDKKALITMDDFLITYGAQILGEENPNLTQTIYGACKDNLKGLDQLFHDHGFGRIHKFEDIAYGFVSDLYDYKGQEYENKVHSILKQAVAYMGSHIKAFNKWKLA